MSRAGLAAIVALGVGCALARTALADEDAQADDAGVPDASEVDAGEPDGTVRVVAPEQPAFEKNELPEPPSVLRRDPGELVLLYFVSIQWAGSISLFIDAMTKTENAYAGASFGGMLGTLATAGVGVAIPFIVDGAFGKRNGAAQTVTSAMLIGLGEGIAWNEYFANRATTSFHTFTKDMAWIFGAETAGLVTGLGVAALAKTTPGRAAWVETTALFGGLFAASLAGAASRADTYNQWSREGERNVGLAGAIAGLAGTATGIATAGLLSPSVLRVHIIDAAWISGAVIPALACNKCNPPDSFAAMAIGSGVSFGLTFLATAWLPKDHGEGARKKKAPAFAPYALPSPGGGLELGIGGFL